MKTKSQKRRGNEGNILIIAIIVIALIVIPLFMMVSQQGLHVVDSQRLQNTVEAAGLVAANDASRIVVNDPNFGFVSLSNYPPIGKATCAPDGEPMPVVGINTLVGTIRQNEIVARELGNAPMAALVESDRNSLTATIAEINNALRTSIDSKNKVQYFDIHGDKVDPLKDVTSFLQSNLPPSTQLESIKVSNGWLAGGGKTTIAIPQPEKIASVDKSAVQQGKYKAFVNIPVANHEYTFAGGDTASTIVSPANFRDADGKHICSIIKVECVFAIRNLTGAKSDTKLRFVSCCQPFSMPETGPAGIMTLRFSGSPVRGLRSWSDLLSENNFHDTQVNMFDVTGGDFPVDPHARMHAFKADRHTTSTAQQFAEHLYCWLRNGHVRPRVDSIIAMLDEPFNATPNQIYAYEFAKGGTISRRVVPRDPFPVGITSDSQCSVIADTTVAGGAAPVIVFRNDVKHLGTSFGGKHGGQPLAGDPLNWCELKEYGGDEVLAKGMGKGRLGTNLTVVDIANPMWPSETNKAVNLDVFRKLDGKALSMQPRKSFYSGGLALDIEIGGLRESTASLDVASMRKLRFTRKI